MRTGSVHACFFFNWDFIAGGEAFADDDDVAALLDKKDLDDNDDEHEHYDDDYGVDKLWNSVNNWLCVLRPCLFLLCFCVCSFQPLQYFFSFVLSFFSFSLCCRCFFVYSLFPLPTRFKVHHRVFNRSSDSHTHIRKINSHSRLLKVKISSLGVLLGDCRVFGFCNVSLSVHTVLYSFAHCSMQASSFYLSAVSHWWWHE